LVPLQLNLGLSFAILTLLTVTSVASPQTSFNVRDFGAKGDGKAKDTSAIQACVNAAEKQGGGIVFLPAGRYLSGTIRLKNNITIQILPGAVLAFSPDKSDFAPYETLDYKSFADNETTYSHDALFLGDSVHDVAIVGSGEIDGNRPKRGGPKPIAFKNSRDITIRGITIKNAPNYCISLLGVDFVTIDSVRIHNAFADGIDPDCSRFVHISNCTIDSSDDAICLKTSLSLGKRMPTEHVTITNCILSSSANDIKLGTESSGDFKNIAINNCAIFRRGRDSGNAGLAIESVDGAIIDGLTVSNLSMQDVYCPIFVRLGNRGRGLDPAIPGLIRNVSISDVVATNSRMTCSISGLINYPVRDISLSNIRIQALGGERHVRDLSVPEQAHKYPESNMFGVLPAWAFYCRHVKGISLRGVTVNWEVEDLRPAVVCDGVENLALSELEVNSAAGAEPALWLNNIILAYLHGCKFSTKAEAFARFSGQETQSVTVGENDLRHVARPIHISTEVSPNAIRYSGQPVR
jgi:polygalacturonase